MSFDPNPPTTLSERYARATITEEWRPVVGWETGYEVSNLGRVRSLARMVRSKNGSTRLTVPLVLKPIQKDYPAVNLSLQGTRLRVDIHVLVLTAFRGPRPDRMEGCHNDGDKHNSALSNLRWDTPEGNYNDRRSHGTSNEGERHPHHRLTRPEVLAIKASDERAAILAARFGVTDGNVRLIKRGKSWRHLKDAA